MRCPLPTVKRRVGVWEGETDSRTTKDARQKLETNLNRPAISGRVVGGGGCVEHSPPTVSRVSKVAKTCNRLDG